MNHIAYSGLRLDDIVFKLHKANAWKLLIKLGKDVGITKPCNPHAFRHAQATTMIQLGYNESIIRKKLGWTGDSKMIGRYIHCVDDDVIDATIEKNGTPIPKPQIKTINPAQAANIVDAASTIAKINAENEQLKQDIKNLQEMVVIRNEDLRKTDEQYREEMDRLFSEVRQLKEYIRKNESLLSQ